MCSPTQVLLVGLSVLVAAAQAQNATNYCTLCTTQNTHTMCKYKPTDQCATRSAGGVDAAGKKAVLDAHNARRNKVARGQETLGAPGPQPAASNMRMMVWDEELALVAQRWANQCTYQHDVCRVVSRFKVGQNIFMRTGSGNFSTTWEEVVASWYNEVKFFNKSDVAVFKQGPNGANQTGHYTQVVWAESYVLGCGMSVFKNMPQNTTSMYYVCNYGPSGNFLRMPVYQQGTACSKCPTGTACSTTYTGLCALKTSGR